jgi:hypothetical protein
MLLASEVGELVAEYRWVAGDAADAHSRDDVRRARAHRRRGGRRRIALLLLCDRTGIDLADAIGGEAGEEPRALPGGQGARQGRAAQG